MFTTVAAIDGLLSGLPPLARIALWGAFSGAVSMAIYAKLSPQQKLQALKSEHKTVRHALMRYDGEWNGMQSLIIRDLTMSLKQVGLVLGPFLASMVPLLELVLCLLILYGSALPEPGAPVLLTASPAGATLQASNEALSPQENGWIIAWPDQPVELTDGKNLLLQLPTTYPITGIGRDSWLERVTPHPEGIIPIASPVEFVEIHLPPVEYTHFGPDWMRGFEFWYFTVLLIVSLYIKIKFKIA